MCQFANKTKIYKYKKPIIIFNLPYLTLTYLTIINISMNKFNKIFCLCKFSSHFVIINFSMKYAEIVLIKY